ncbi:MAG: HEAT repeat domain-containing protein [Planctomycetaceae bacterium]|nr:HEAT repeat domain-containing protein [Planctomycetaceae bacterium]
MNTSPPGIWPPTNDPRSIDELINTALSASDGEVRWDAICVLHWRGTQEVLQWAMSLCHSACPDERRLGVDILAQLGVPERTFSRECETQLLKMLHDEDAAVYRATLYALSSHAAGVPMEPFRCVVTHPDWEVRRGLFALLTDADDPVATDLLIQLSADEVDEIRDWATFGLGTIREADSPEIRSALAARLDDPHDDTRAEAIVGLAQRHDPRVLPALIRDLSENCVATLHLEAAEHMPSPELVPLLKNLRSWWDVDPEGLERAIACCEAQC